MGRQGNAGKATIFDNISVLILMGVLAGAAGGLVVGIVTGSHSSSSAAAPTNAQPIK